MQDQPESDEDAFLAPGSMLGGRYRVISRLGKGGMGEVYRADDLKLGQAVALKFLPRSLGNEPRRLSRFREEVKISRQVAHPNVCRVYDMGDVETPTGTLHYLSMEYIDGEDLSSLLRRIGRLPKDKAVQVARQLCAGLAAAHNAGVLHRDLKPANIMLDGRGQAKITDFGIAGAIGNIVGSDVRSGTPAYMAPESLAGREVSPKSDIYSLGLVLYELFTGRQAFAGATVTTASSSRTSTRVNRPSTIIEDMDPVTERVIMRCLDHDPGARPSSALAVAAALPGGDPLLAALEAGETPSPELVAAAGPTGTIKPVWAGTMVAICVALLAVFFWASPQTGLVSYLPLERSPDVLEDRAKETLRTLGNVEKAVDSKRLIRLNRGYLQYIAYKQVDDLDRWEALRTGRPAVSRFAYRDSPSELMPMNATSVVTLTDPPATEPGMRHVELDLMGNLTFLSVVPKSEIQSDRDVALAGATADAVEPLVSKLFTLSGLDRSKFEPGPVRRRPPHDADVHLAWDGVYPEAGLIALHIEAAFVDGMVVWYRMFAPWELDPQAVFATAPDAEGDKPAEAADEKAAAGDEKAQTEANRAVTKAAKAKTTGPSRAQQLLQAIVMLTVMSGLLFASLLARKNYRIGRGDTAGASRLAGAIIIAKMVIWVLMAHHIGVISVEFNRFMTGLAISLLPAAMAWTLYMALEPIVRRRDPRLLVSWTRLLAGSWRDPLIGRHVLVACTTSCLIIGAMLALTLYDPWMGKPMRVPFVPKDLMLAGTPGAMAAAFSALLQSVINSLRVYFFFVGMSVLVRQKWIAAALLFVLLSIILIVEESGGGAMPEWQVILMLAGIGAGITLFIVRFGLLALIVMNFTFILLQGTPFTMNLAEWYARGTVVMLLVVGGLLAWGYISATGRSSRVERIATT